MGGGGGDGKSAFLLLQTITAEKRVVGARYGERCHSEGRCSCGMCHLKLLLALEREAMLKKLKIVSFINEQPGPGSGFNLGIQEGEAVDSHESEANLVYPVRSRTARAIQ